MHAQSFDEMQKCYRRYIHGTALETKNNILVLDIGGDTSERGYYPIFNGLKARGARYVGADLRPRPGVDLVLADPYKIPLADSSADIVISGQTFEHCEFFWLLFAEMIRVLTSDGYLFLIAPSAGPIHRFPVDCYRFNPDSYRSLAKYTKSQLLDVWRNDSEPWRDLVGAFRKEFRPPHPASIVQYQQANRDRQQGQFRSAIEKYRLIEQDYADDEAFLTNFSRAAEAAGDYQEAFRLAHRLAEGFNSRTPTLLMLGRCAFRTGRYAGVRDALSPLTRRPRTMLAALGWEMAHGRRTKNDALVRHAALTATKAILGGRAPRPYPAWVVTIVQQFLSQENRLHLLRQLNEKLHGT